MAISISILSKQFTLYKYSRISDKYIHSFKLQQRTPFLSTFQLQNDKNMFTSNATVHSPNPRHNKSLAHPITDSIYRSSTDKADWQQAQTSKRSNTHIGVIATCTKA